MEIGFRNVDGAHQDLKRPLLPILNSAASMLHAM